MRCAPAVARTAAAACASSPGALLLPLCRRCPSFPALPLAPRPRPRVARRLHPALSTICVVLSDIVGLLTIWAGHRGCGSPLPSVLLLLVMHPLLGAAVMAIATLGHPAPFPFRFAANLLMLVVQVRPACLPACCLPACLLTWRGFLGSCLRGRHLQRPLPSPAAAPAADCECLLVHTSHLGSPPSSSTHPASARTAQLRVPASSGGVRSHIGLACARSANRSAATAGGSSDGSVRGVVCPAALPTVPP